METCIFCKIIRGEIPSKKAYEDKQLLAFYDIHPQAPLHLLIIPKQHFDNLNAVNSDSAFLFSEMLKLAQTLAKEHKLADRGYRLVINTNSEGGQSVDHLHLHLLGGNQMGPSMVG